MSITWSDGRGRVTAGGASLEWETQGADPATTGRPVIVMLHEGLGSVGLWRDTPAQLHARTGLPVFAYSRAGHGQSDPAALPRPLDYMTREAVDVLPEILDAIGAERVILMGHSDGATIAAEYAGRVEDFRVRGLILLAPHFFPEETGLAEIARTAAAFRDGDLRERIARHHRDPDATFRGWCDAWLDPAFRDWDVSEVIDYLRVPALVIQGRQDPYGTEAQVREIADRSYAPVDTLMLDECRHAPHLEQPEAVLDAISEFTARLERIEAAEVETA